MPPAADAGRESLLVLRAQSGDLEALGDLFRIFGTRIAAHIRYIVRNDALAEDVLQDVFVIVHRKLRWLRTPETFQPWLYRIASREAVRTAKRHNSRPDQLSEDAFEWSEVADRSSHSAEARLLTRDLETAVAGVSPASRAVLSLHYLEDLTLHEAAEVLGIPLGTAKSRLSAGLAQLRERFAVHRAPRGPRS